MSEIEKAAGEELVRRMRNWARWKCGLGPDGQGSEGVSSIYRGLFRYGRPDGDRMPTLNGEALDTDGALQCVEIRYRQAVEWYWQWEGRSLVWLARRRGVSDKTYKAWVIRGHELLRFHLTQRHALIARQAEDRRRMAIGC